MTLSDFDYTLPPELIAQTPIEPRDSSRLLVLDRARRTITHRRFHEIGDYLAPSDLLVVNQSRVLPARLRGVKAPSGGRVEVLLLAVRGDIGPDCWEALVRPGRRIQEGQRLVFGDGLLAATVLSRTPSGGRVVQLEAREGALDEALVRIGTIPLPPYISTPLADPSRYQTVYARESGSAAAPTAGLHFTPGLLMSLQAQGVGLATVTLHIGLDTFRPMTANQLDEHVMHSEEIEMDAATARQINITRSTGGRIVAVGTTSVRVLESVASQVARQPDHTADTLVSPYRGRTALFIRPGYVFQAVDVMLTNFHLPRSSLLVLVSAFAGRDLIQRAYAEAIEQRYRFYSFGDAMLIL